MKIDVLKNLIIGKKKEILDNFAPEKNIEFIDAINSLSDYVLYSDNIDFGEEEELLKLLIDTTSILFNNYGYRAITDTMYDELEYRLSKLNSLIVTIGAPNKNDVKISTHKYPDLRGTLKKVYSIKKTNKNKDDKTRRYRESLEDWITYLETKKGSSLDIKEAEVYLEPKIDGVSVEFSVDKDGKVIEALSRGNVETNEAQDFTDKFYYIDRFESLGVPYGLKTEVFMKYEDFEKLIKDYDFSTPLSAVSGILNSNTVDKELIKYLSFFQLRRQREGSNIIELIHDNSERFNLNNLSKIEKRIEKIRKEYEGVIPIDGVVIILADEEFRNRLGRENHKSIGEVAYKFPPESKETVLERIDWQVGLLGNITPVAKVKPVVIKNKTISSISLGSKDRFLQLDLHEGDRVTIEYDIIPYLIPIEQEHVGYKFEAPTHCQFCNEELDDKTFKCINQNCSSKEIGKIIHFITSLGVEGLGEKSIVLLRNNGIINSLSDIFRLKDKADKISKLPKMGIISAYNIIEAVEKFRKITPVHFFGSLGIPSIGRRIFSKIFSKYTVDELLDICKENRIDALIEIDGIGTIYANTIIDGINSNIKEIEYIINKEVELIDEEEKVYNTTVYFTKVRDKDFADFLDKNNVLVSDNFNKKVNYLIIKDKDTVSKKVGKYDIPVLTLEEAYEKFGYKK